MGLSQTNTFQSREGVYNAFLRGITKTNSNWSDDGKVSQQLEDQQQQAQDGGAISPFMDGLAEASPEIQGFCSISTSLTMSYAIIPWSLVAVQLPCCTQLPYDRPVSMAAL